MTKALLTIGAVLLGIGTVLPALFSTVGAVISGAQFPIH